MESVSSSLDLDPEVYDVIIVGAGPCGLAVAARLQEQTPAAIFTDEEHRRYHWIRRYGRNMSIKHVKSGKTSYAANDLNRAAYSMVVLDAEHDVWMGRWNRLFNTYEIPHLRSHLLWHIDPLDRDSLLAKACDENKLTELTEMKGCVGKEVSKHLQKKRRGQFVGSRKSAKVDINQREHKDYFNPSRTLFADHCRAVVERYKLDRGIVHKESLQDLDYGEVRGISVDGENLFTVRTNKTTRYARAVVLAVGPANAPILPREVSFSLGTHKVTEDIGQAVVEEPFGLPQVSHTMHITTFPAPVVQERMRAGQQTNVLVVGGGLTSAQLSDLAVRRGVTTVWHVARGPLRVKHFDVDLAWMGKYRNGEQARFWSADSNEERLDMIREARGGGSVTPAFHRRLRQHVQSGQLVLRDRTVLVEAVFQGGNEKREENKGSSAGCAAWLVKTEPPIADMPPMDYIYFATGIETDFASLPYLRRLLDKFPITSCGGFPGINESLMWRADVPLYLAGRLAALQLGPAAPNLGGAMIGAERIAWSINESISKSKRVDGVPTVDSAGCVELDDYVAGRGSKYSSLLVDG